MDKQLTYLSESCPFSSIFISSHFKGRFLIIKVDQMYNINWRVVQSKYVADKSDSQVEGHNDKIACFLYIKHDSFIKRKVTVLVRAMRV